MHDIYKLKLHEKFRWEDKSVMRVPGGWIYQYYGPGVLEAAVFVPFDNGFQQENEDE